MRNSVAEFVPDPQEHYRKGDASIMASGDDFAAYFRGEISAAELIRKSKTSDDATELLGAFDSYVSVPMYR